MSRFLGLILDLSRNSLILESSSFWYLKANTKFGSRSEKPMSKPIDSNIDDDAYTEVSDYGSEDGIEDDEVLEVSLGNFFFMTIERRNQHGRLRFPYIRNYQRRMTLRSSRDSMNPQLWKKGTGCTYTRILEQRINLIMRHSAAAFSILTSRGGSGTQETLPKSACTRKQTVLWDITSVYPHIPVMWEWSRCPPHITT